jgi:hypothetical protein
MGGPDEGLGVGICFHDNSSPTGKSGLGHPRQGRRSDSALAGRPLRPLRSQMSPLESGQALFNISNLNCTNADVDQLPELARFSGRKVTVSRGVEQRRGSLDGVGTARLSVQPAIDAGSQRITAVEGRARS